MAKTNTSKHPTRSTILVSGGAGYLGGTMSRVLERQGFQAIALDNFSTSRRRESPPPQGIDLREIDLADWAAVNRLADQLGPVEGIVHFAARCLVSESCEKPDLDDESRPPGR